MSRATACIGALLCAAALSAPAFAEDKVCQECSAEVAPCAKAVNERYEACNAREAAACEVACRRASARDAARDEACLKACREIKSVCWDALFRDRSECDRAFSLCAMRMKCRWPK